VQEASGRHTVGKVVATFCAALQCRAYGRSDTRVVTLIYDESRQRVGRAVMI